MKKALQRSILLYGLMLMMGCASLTKSQINEVNAFGHVTQDFSAYPVKVITTLNDVHTQSQLYQVNSIIKPENHLKSVDILYEDIKRSARLDSATDLAFRIINDYGQKLVRLTSDSYTSKLDTASQKLGTNLDGMIGQYNKLAPKHSVSTGIGALFGQLVTFLGDSYIRSKQANGAKMFVAKGDTLIGSMTATVVEFLAGKDGKLKNAIKDERDNVRTNFRIFLNRNDEKIVILKKADTVYTGTLDAWRASSFEPDRLYLTLLQNLDADELLRQQCIEAVINLRKAHAKLLQDLDKKKELTEIYTDLQDYATSISEMNTTTKSIK